MYITCKRATSESDVFRLLCQITQESRFTAKFDRHPKWGIKYHSVRLKTAKPYCGQHPGPCVALSPRPHRTCKFPEGLDWIGLHQMLNDALDAVGADCDVFSYNREAFRCYSGKYYIRRGKSRRLYYPYEFVGDVAGWTQGKDDLECLFEDFCGKEPPEVDLEIADSGTPGYPVYTLEEEAAYAAVGHH